MSLPRLTIVLAVAAFASLDPRAAAQPSAQAHEPGARTALLLTLDHGVTQLREPGEDVEWSGAHASVDLRVHAPTGWGGMIRVGTSLGDIVTLEAETGPAARAWLWREGPRGIALGGAAGVTLLWNSAAPSNGVTTELAGGAFASVQLDYHEHGFVVGVGYLYRWLPLREEGALDTLTLSAFARVGGELPF